MDGVQAPGNSWASRQASTLHPLQIPSNPARFVQPSEPSMFPLVWELVAWMEGTLTAEQKGNAP